MAERTKEHLFDPPSPSQKQAISPKRKRIDSFDQAGASQHEVATRQLHSGLNRVLAQTGHLSDNDKPITDAEVEDFLKRCNNHFAWARAQKERSELTLNRRVLNSITAIQVTQARTGGDLLKLTNELHDFAHQLNEQERYLHQERAKLSHQQQDFSNKLLEDTVNQMRATMRPAETSPTSLQAAQAEIAQLKNKVTHLEFQLGSNDTIIETLISKRMIDEEARTLAEARLRGVEAELRRLQATGNVLINYPMPDGDEVEEYIPTDSPTYEVSHTCPAPATCVVAAHQKRHSMSPPPLPAWFRDVSLTNDTSNDDPIEDGTSTEEGSRWILSPSQVVKNV